MHGDGAAGAWDAHSKLKDNHTRNTGQVDRPIAGLLTDLKRRGLLNETIVVFATEFRPHTRITERRRSRPPSLRLFNLHGGWRDQGGHRPRRH